MIQANGIEHIAICTININFLILTDNTILHLSVDGGHFNTVEWIVNNIPQLLHAINKDGNSPVHVAAAKGQLKVMQLLLQHGANLTEAGDTSNNLNNIFSLFLCPHKLRICTK